MLIKGMVLVGSYRWSEIIGNRLLTIRDEHYVVTGSNASQSLVPDGLQWELLSAAAFIRALHESSSETLVYKMTKNLDRKNNELLLKYVTGIFYVIILILILTFVWVILSIIYSEFIQNIQYCTSFLDKLQVFMKLLHLRFV